MASAATGRNDVATMRIGRRPARMTRLGTGHLAIMKDAPVVVQPPGPDGGRRVTIRGEYVGTAYHLLDVVEFLRRAGLPEANTTVDDPDLIEWRGMGPKAWTAAG
ncbi:hypothetical protein [Streptomyces sp. NPDC054804]